MAHQTADLGAAILALLPDDGTPILNRVMRTMLARKLERVVGDDAFFAARDALLAAGAVGRLRGPGGQLFRTRPATTAKPLAEPKPAAGSWSESQLMAPLRRFLDGPFRASLDLSASGADPSAPAPKAKAPPRSTGSKTGKALQSKALKPRAPKKTASKEAG